MGYKWKNKMKSIEKKSKDKEKFLKAWPKIYKIDEAVKLIKDKSKTKLFSL